MVKCPTNASSSNPILRRMLARASCANAFGSRSPASIAAIIARNHEPRPTGQVRKRWMMRRKPALNAFEIAFDGRVAAGRT